MIMGFLSVCLDLLNIFQQYFVLFYFFTKFISRYFTVFNTVVSETVSLISFSEYLLLVYKNTTGDFPAGPVVNSLSSQSRGPRFAPWSGN